MRLFAFIFCVLLTGAVPAQESFAVEATEEIQSVSPKGGDAAVSAFKFAARDRWSDARREVARSKNPVARKVLHWMEYKEGAPGITFKEISAFVSQNPDWPMLDKMRVEAEKAIPDNLPDDQIIAWFSQYQPFTMNGMDMYAQALIRSDKKDEVRQVIHTWWETTSVTRDQQKQFYTRYKSYLARENHIERLNMLLAGGENSNARAVADLLGPDYRALTEARIALATGEGNANPYVDKVPASLQNDEGLLYERLRWRRRHDLDEGAIDILSKEPAFDKKREPAAWWQERQIIVRRQIEEKQYARAYQIVNRHRQKEGAPFAESEWLAGWLALRFLNKPWDAFEHFERMYHKVETPISRGRAAYWAGRASAALKHPEVAKKWY